MTRSMSSMPLRGLMNLVGFSKKTALVLAGSLGPHSSIDITGFDRASSSGPDVSAERWQSCALFSVGGR